MHFRLPSTAAASLAAVALLHAAPAAAQDVVAITRRAGPAVVTLHTFNANGRETGLGSGFFLPDGRIATNRHVVEGATRIRVVGNNERELGGATYAEAVGRSADLAILPRIGSAPATLPVATRLPEAGESVVVIGAPEGLSNTVSTGIVSAIRQIGGRTLVQISAPISHGSSGGPVLNMRGEVIGVSVSILSEGQNLNFAVPATELQSLSRTSPGRIAFTDNLRGEGSAGGADISTQNVGRLPRIASGQTVSGRLASGDFVMQDGSFADSYVYQGRAGEQITVSLRSRDFDSWLIVDDPTGPMRETDDDGGGNLDSELTVTLPRTGTYLIVANSVAPGATGAYSMTLRSGGGGGNNGNNGNNGYVPSTGGSGDVTELTRRNLPSIGAGQTVTGQITRGSFRRSDDNSLANGYAYNGRAGERITVTLRSRDFDSYLIVDDPNGPLRESDDDSGGGNDAQVTVTLPHDGRYVIVANTVSAGETGNYTLSVQSSGGGGYRGGGYDGPSTGGRSGTLEDLARTSLPSIAAGRTISGQLTRSSFLRTDDNTYVQAYTYRGTGGERLSVTMRSASFDSWLIVADANGRILEYDDDSAGGNDARVTMTLPSSGTYLIIANAVSDRSTGPFTLTVQSSAGSRSIRPLN